MAKKNGDKTSFRLHPRLRVFENGAQEVNQARSQCSGLVATEVTPSLMSADKLWRQSLTLTALVQPASGSEGFRKRVAKPSRRAKASSSPSTDSYINVLIELERGRGGDGDGGSLGAAAIESYIKKAMHGASAGIPRILKRRRNFIAATVPISALDILRSDDNIAFVHAPEPLRFTPPESRPAVSRRAPMAEVDAAKTLGDGGNGILIGIIDVGGFDFSHTDFLDAAGETRFLSIWDQGGVHREPPKGFSHGSELLREHLNKALATERAGGLPAQYLERQSQMEEGSHGTHVASIAAGKHGLCPKAHIAAVLINIPPEDDPNEQRRRSFSDSTQILDAVEYLVGVAKQHNLPLSINISLGTNGGAHDGSGGVSRWLDALLASKGHSICVAAGNAGQEKGLVDDDVGWMMGRIHTSGQIASRGLSVDLEWTVLGNGVADFSENELEIWYGAEDRVSVWVQPPNTDHWFKVGVQEFIENRRLPSGTHLSVYNELYHPTNGDNYIAIFLSPDYTPERELPIEAGVWRIRLVGDEIRNGRFNAWIERDDPVRIGRRGAIEAFRLPSFFSVTTNVDSHSIGSLACSHRIIAVANLDAARHGIHITSSQGPTRDERQKPDIAAPGTNIAAANGFGGTSNLLVEMTGTSMASPFVAGVVGLMLARNPNLSAAQIQGILKRTAQPLPGASYSWRNDSGFGVINPLAAVKEAETFSLRTNVG